MWLHPDLGLRRGARYLLSMSALHRKAFWPGGNVSSPVAWRLHGDRAGLVTTMDYRDQLGELWPGFAEADTLAEVLAIVAPDVPTTDALFVPILPVRTRTSEASWGTALLAGAVGAWLALRRTRRGARHVAPARPPRAA